MNEESDRLVLRAIPTAILCAFFVMICQVASVAINITRERSCPPCQCQLEKP